MNELEKIKMHLGEKVELKIGEDIILLNKFDVEDFSLYLGVSGNFESAKDDDSKKIETIQKNIPELLRIFTNVVMKSVSTDRETAEDFVLANMQEFLNSTQKFLPKV